MNVISKKFFWEACEQYPADSAAIRRLYGLLDKGTWLTPDIMRKTLNSLDNFTYEKGWWVIDIAGNSLRLIAYINFEYETLYVKHIVSHAEYDKLCKKYREKKKKTTVTIKSKKAGK